MKVVHNNRMIFVSVRAQVHPSGGSLNLGFRTLASGNWMGERGSIVVAVFFCLFFLLLLFKRNKDFVII